MTWSQAFRKFIWIPIILLTLFISGFVYDTINSGLSWILVYLYLSRVLLYLILLYLPMVLYARYSVQMAYIMLFILLGIFGFGTLKGNIFADAMRSYIQEDMSLEFFVGFLTIAALLIAVDSVLRVKKDGKQPITYPSRFPRSRIRRLYEVLYNNRKFARSRRIGEAR